MILAMNYEDRLAVADDRARSCVLQQFYMCPGCGMYMPAKFWRVGLKSNGGEKWYCGLNWAEVTLACPKECQSLVRSHGSLEAAEKTAGFCEQLYRPFAKGAAAVVEFMHCNKWYYMLADMMPELLRDEIQKHQTAFFTAMDLLTPEDLKSAIPVVMPKTNAIPNCNIPGLGKLDKKAYLDGNNAVMTEKNWWLFALYVAKRDRACLKTIFDLAELRSSL
jgi:hypothetical protein